ncbi:MAG: response regulator [Candidatus Accumulibacter sp.]|nr:response regulator [Accumulibacter sp.]
MKLGNLKVGRRLYLGFGTLLLLLIGVTLIGYVSMESLNDKLRLIGQANVPKLMLAQDLSEAEYRMARDIRTLVIVTDQATMRKVKADIDRARVDFDTAWNHLGKLPLSEEGRSLLSRIKEAREAARPANDLVMELGLANKNKEAGRILLERAFPGNKRVQDLLSEFMELEDRFTRENVAQSHQAYATAQFWMALLTGIALLAGTLIAFLITRSIVRPLGGEPAAVQEVMKRLSDGDLSAGLNVEKSDTTSMAYSINVMIGTLARLADRAEAIGRGDFSQDVPLLSDRDQLGKAVNRMNLMLRQAKEENDARNWIKDGYSRLSADLTGGLSVQQQADTAIEVLGRYLSAGRGVLYVYRPDEAALDLLGSYMHVQRTHLANRFRVGEGAIGQVAREKKPIILTTAAPDAAPIVTGIVNAVPYYTYTYPLLREETLLGVVELASFECFDPLKLEFLLGATEMVAAFLYVAEQQERVRTLLTVAESAEKEARTQSERLQEANARMEEQQQLLQQQTEELRQSNAQLEEQQQQVQQQSEELQLTNAQLEEQQRQLEQNNLELRRSREELDAKARQLTQSGQYKTEFLANMSHELRTPLNAIILLSKMMAGNEKGHLEPDEIRQAEVIHRAGEDLLRLINDVLDLSKVEAGRMDLRWSEVDSAALSDSCRELFEPAAHERGLSFAVEDRLRGHFVSDSDKIEQILRNLLSNALKFTKEGGVTLCFKRQAGDALPIRIEVRDTGVGIPLDRQTLIFEAFRQVDGSTSREYGGTGLGLTISLRFAQLLGGDIELESTPGKGSVFALRLPESPVDQVAQTSLAAAEQPPAAEQITESYDDRDRLEVGDRVILLIDDDPAFGMILMALNRKLGHKTLVAACGADGLALARRHRPTGILLDLGLPDMDGTRVLHALKTDPDLAQIPVYVISARDRDAALLRQGIVGYLQKPVDTEQIARAENEVLAAGVALLVVTSGGINADEISHIAGFRCGLVRQCTDGPALQAALAERAWRLAIIDLAGHTSDEGVAIAQSIRQADAGTALVFFSTQPLSEVDEARLRAYTDSIIVKTPQVDQRLLDSIERFVREAPTARSGGATVSANGEGIGKRLAGRQVLVVDDDPRNLFVITAALEQNGARVSGAINGKQALALLEKTSVDLVVTDIMMPEMDGYQTIARIRDKPALADLPIIALTAKALPEDKEKALAAGANDYLSKPVDYDVLINMIALWCSRR